MSAVPDPQGTPSGDRLGAERVEDAYDILSEALSYAGAPLGVQEDLFDRMDAFLMREALRCARVVQDDPDIACGCPRPQPVRPRSTSRIRRNALRRRVILVHTLLIVAVATVFVSLYAMALGQEAGAWFGLAGAMGLCWMADRAAVGR